MSDKNCNEVATNVMVACCLLTGISIQSETGEALSGLLMEE